MNGANMEFPSPLTQAVLLKRYKRFLAEIVLNNQEHRIIYCPNMGNMAGCDVLGSKIWFSRSDNPRRKFPDTWELVEVNEGHLVCINTQNANPLVLEAIQNNVIEPLQGYQKITFEPPAIGEHSFDLLLEQLDESTALTPVSIQKCYIATQGVTLGDEIHRGFFPDTPTSRGLQLLKSLIQAKQLGHRAVLIYCVMHTGIERIFPADHIDFEYGRMLRQAVLAGVEIIGYKTEINLQKIQLVEPVEVCVPVRMISSSRSEKSR